MTSTLSATVLNIQRMSTEDGPGLRTTVFLKGCSLECAWCHNPEAVSAQPQVVWYRTRCIGAGSCVSSCPEDALARRDGEIVIDRARCTACGDCVEQCPSGALETLGRRWGLEELVAEVAKDSSYFHSGGGGVTVSGGEPGVRAPFVAAFLERCRALGLHTAIDTCGMCSQSALDALAEQADLVLYDLKEIDSDRHRRFTGQPNERILANLVQLGRFMRKHERPSQLWIRTPLIPGATFTDENIYGIGAFIARHVGDLVSRWELCAFNNLAGDKYERLGRHWQYEGAQLLSDADLRHAEEVARASGVDPAIVIATGRTAASEAPVEAASERQERGDSAAG